jgi:hypothetical protein
MQFPSQNSRFLCNRPDGPLKASGRPAVSKSFSVNDVWMSKQHRLDARSSFSNFYTEFYFSRHCLGSFCKTSGRCGSTYERCPTFQIISGFLYERGKKIQRSPSRHSAKPSRHGPVMGRIALFWKGGCNCPSGRSVKSSGHPPVF